MSDEPSIDEPMRRVTWLKSERSYRARFWPIACVVLLTGAAYANTFRVPFLFDDAPSILENATLVRLRDAWKPPSQFGLTVAGRPLLNLSLAINYVLTGLRPWSYHLFNLLFHLAAALLLYGSVRRTLKKPVVAEALRVRANEIGAAIALLWAVHPLQTESVTYVIQRAESLMGMWYMLTFYAVIRSVESSRRRLWEGVAVVACLLGAATKEVIVTAPLLIFLYDRTFIAGTFRSAWRERRGLYLGLLVSWIVLGALVFSAGGNRGGTFSLSGRFALTYWASQTEAIVRYLKLSLWPHPLVFENGLARVPEGWRLPVFALIVAALVTATIRALQKHPQLGFLGAWFFLILSPTSVMPGITQSIVEHRMYLSLAAVLAGAVCLLVIQWGRAGLIVGFVCVPVAAFATYQRNQVYQNEQTLWEETLIHAPYSAIAHGNLATVLYNQGRFEEAIVHYQASTIYDPQTPGYHYNLGLAYNRLNQAENALAEFYRCVALNPLYYPAHYKAAGILRSLGRRTEAEEQVGLALKIKPDEARLHELLGALASDAEEWSQARAEFEQAVRLEPTLVSAQLGLGVAEYHLKNYEAAESHLKQVDDSAPELAKAPFYLGLISAQRGDRQGAGAAYQKALRSDPGLAEAQLNLGILLAQDRALSEALPHLEAAVKLAPREARAHENLANALFELEQIDRAETHYRISLDLEPTNPLVHYNLANALLAQKKMEEAQSHFAEAARLDPRQTAAAEMAERIAAYLSEPRP